MIQKRSQYLLGLFICFILSGSLFGQNIAITDDNAYVADSSAMLDVKSVSKGLLIPRLTSTQRTTISNPATGLLVYDSVLDVFFYYDGSDWINISKGQVWDVNSEYVYLTSETNKVGIGTNTPNSKLEVRADASFTANDTLFSVKDKDGNIVFAVFPDGAKVYVNTDAKGSIGGFAVSGRSPTKAIEEDYLKVTPDSTRIWIKEDPAKGSIGGFAVSGRSPTKGIVNDYFVSTADSTRIYVNDSVSVKGSIGGFAVSGRSPTKGYSGEYFISTADSTRIYVNDSSLSKGRIGGFAVSGRSPTKAGSKKFMDMTKENYFIGHLSGQKNVDGEFNSFMGYEAGFENISGDENIFVGYRSGYNNIEGLSNNFIGYQSGYSNSSGDYNTYYGFESGYANTTSSRNTFIGYNAGRNATGGNDNIFMGYQAGLYHINGSNNIYLGNNAGSTADTIPGYSRDNVFIGTSSGANNEFGNYNVFVGFETGLNNRGTGAFNTASSQNVFLGYQAGHSNTTGNRNIYVGYKAGYSNLTRSSNVFIGESAGEFNTKGGNVFVGAYAGGDGDATSSTYIGYASGNNASGAANTYLGFYSGNSAGSGMENVYIGHGAGKQQAGYYNVIIGKDAGSNAVSTAYENTFVGKSAGFNATGGSNVFMGKDVGFNNVGSSNVFIGREAGRNATGSDNVFIGDRAGYSETGDDLLYIANSSSTPLIWGDFANDSVKINGVLNINSTYSFPDSDGGINSVMKTDGSGNVSWADVNTLVNGDNLGDHSATQNLDLNTNNIIDVGGVGVGTGAVAPEELIELAGSSGNSPGILLRRGTATDVFTDWKIEDNGGYLRTYYRVSSSTWNHATTIDPNTGYFGIGTTTPDANLHVVNTAGITPTIGAGTVGVFQQNSGASNWSRVAILGGTGGYSTLDFGDDDDVDIGGIRYRHTSDDMYIITNSTVQMTIASNGDVNVNGEINNSATGAANMIPIAYGNISSAGGVNTGSGNISVSRTGTGTYQVTITGESYLWTSYISSITILSGGALIANAASVSGKLVVNIYNASGVKTDAAFSFVTYKP